MSLPWILTDCSENAHSSTLARAILASWVELSWGVSSSRHLHQLTWLWFDLKKAGFGWYNFCNIWMFPWTCWSCWVLLNVDQLIWISCYLLTIMTTSKGRSGVQIFSTAVTGILVLLMSVIADHHVVVASGPSVAASLGSGGNSGSAGLGSFRYSSAKATKGVPAVATNGSTGSQPAPWRPPVVNLQYFGGPVMSKPIRVHLIWYVGILCFSCY